MAEVDPGDLQGPHPAGRAVQRARATRRRPRGEYIGDRRRAGQEGPARGGAAAARQGAARRAAQPAAARCGGRACTSCRRTTRGRGRRCSRRRAAPAPDDRDIALRLAEACLGASRVDDARAALQGLLERDPNDQDARQQLAQVFLAEGRFDEAFEQSLPVVDKLVERRAGRPRRGAAAADRPEEPVARAQPGQAGRALPAVAQRPARRADLLAAGRGVPRRRAAQDQAASILEMLVQLEPTQRAAPQQAASGCASSRRSAGFDVDLAHPAPAAARPWPRRRPRRPRAASS